MKNSGKRTDTKNGSPVPRDDGRLPSVVAAIVAVAANTYGIALQASIGSEERLSMRGQRPC